MKNILDLKFFFYRIRDFIFNIYREYLLIRQDLRCALGIRWENTRYTMERRLGMLRGEGGGGRRRKGEGGGIDGRYNTINLNILWRKKMKETGIYFIDN